MISADLKIEQLFASDVHRPIEEVIKVDQAAEEIIRDEIQEYIVTGALQRHFTTILERYRETPNRPHERIAVWVSGFFGSGKSSFAKILGLAVSARPILGESAAVRFAEHVGDPRIRVLLDAITQQIPTHAVIFDVSTDRGIKSGNQTLTEIMYRLFLQSLGYARDLDLAELEIALEGEGVERLQAFKDKYRELLGKDWDTNKGKVAFALSEASRVMHALDSTTYPQADSWVKAVKDKADITPGKLAERCTELMERRRPGLSLMFVVDEVGQFVARDVSKMLDLQAVVQSLGRVGRGKHWVVVTSQEKLNELVGGLDDRRVELSRLMDRFPQELQVHLENSDISEVTSKRVLKKNAEAQQRLRRLFEDHRGRLTDHTRVSARFRLPELTMDGFVDLYPLLPYQVDLIIQVVSGLRTHGGSSRHVGGANRTIIKLAQQLLINPAVNLAAQPLGRLARLDHVYDLVEGNIASEVRGKISAIASEVAHPMAQRVAKAICVLQFVQSIPCTAENLAACLHEAVDGDSCLGAVREALEALERAHKIRLGEEGYRIPSPVEDNWEQQRAGLQPRPGDVARLLTENVASFWQPQPPSHVLQDTKKFTAGLTFNGRPVLEGDMEIHVQSADAGATFDRTAAELRARSQVDTQTIFWAIAVDSAIDRECVEVYRSKEMLSRKERDVRGSEEGAGRKDRDARGGEEGLGRLVQEEKNRQGRHQLELRRLLKSACLSGSVYFRGNDRSPDDTVTEVGKAAAGLLAHALPKVSERFAEAAAKVQRRDLDELLTCQNLLGLPTVFAELKLLRDEKGRPVFRTESGALAEVFRRIEVRTSYGDTASGKWLTEELGREPFGWEFDVVRLLVASLLRAGKLQVTSRGQIIEQATSVDARETFGNNNLFRAATFRPKVGLDFADLVRAAEAFKFTFGEEIKELEQGTIAAAIREKISSREDGVDTMQRKLAQRNLPGAQVLEGVLEQMRSIRRADEANAILAFNAGYNSLKEALDRRAELEKVLVDSRLHDVERAQAAMSKLWPVLRDEPDVPGEVALRAEELADLLKRETFFGELPAIDHDARAIEEEYAKRHRLAAEARAATYQQALVQLRSLSEWDDLTEDQQHRLASPLEACATVDGTASVPISQLRSDQDACAHRVAHASARACEWVVGDRVAVIHAQTFFAGGIETAEQLEAAINNLRDECSRLIGAGKTVLVQ